MAAISVAALRPEMTRREEEVWCELVERRCGICFSKSRLYVLHNCLWREMQKRGIDSYGDYYWLVLQSAAEWSELLERLVNRETYFFRHMPSFAALSEELLPSLLVGKLSRGLDRIAMWSAGCASGEEAYSMAIAAKEAAHPGDGQFEILGSDVSAEALAAARRARFGERAVAAMPQPLRERYFSRTANGYELDPAIHALVRFEPFNFLDPVTYPAAAQDVIFCQNVFIYFREEVRVQAAASLAACLRPGGFLLPAPGELAGLPVPGLEWLRLRHTVVLRRNGLSLPDTAARL
jgi:type IV pilus assembly protein PilK